MPKAVKLAVVAALLAGVAAFYYFSKDSTIMGQHHSEPSSEPHLNLISSANHQKTPAASGVGFDGTRKDAFYSEEKKSLEDAFKNAQSTSLASALHRASVTKSYYDVIAARSVLSTCSSGHDLNRLQLLRPDINRYLIKKLSDSSVYCDLQGQYSQLVEQLRAINFKGASRREQLLTTPPGTLLTVDERIEALRFAIGTGSASLISYAADRFADENIIYSLGLSTNAGIPAGLDLIMVQWAAKILACQETGSCSLPSLISSACVDTNDCVFDLSEYPAKFIYGSEAGGVVQMTFSRHVSPERRAQRWQEVRAWVASLSSQR